MKLQKYYDDYDEIIKLEDTFTYRVIYWELMIDFDDMQEIFGSCDIDEKDYLKHKYPSKPPESEPPLKKQKKDLVYIKNNIISNVDNVSDKYHIPVGVEIIGEGAFNRCINLTEVEIPNTVTKIEKEAFFKCSALTSINIPESVTEIGNEAFFIVNL